MLSSLRVRMLVLALVVVAPTIVIVVLSAREQRRLLAAEAARSTTALAQLVGERHQRSVDAARGLLVGMARMRSIRERNGPACEETLAPLLAREPSFVNMGAVDARGVLFCSAAPRPGAVDLSDRTFFREALRTGGLGVGDWVVSRVRRTGAIGFAYPVRGDDGAVVAVSFASLAVAEIQRELDALELPAGAEVAVLDRRGVTISARPGAAGWTGRPFEPRLVDALRGGPGPRALAGTDGVQRLYDLREVTAPDGTVAMHVIAGIPTGALLEPVDRIAGRALLAALLASGLALAAAGLVVDSAPGRGAEFAIYLPLAEGEPADVAAERRDRPARGSETVLLVEDDERVRAVVRRTLAAHGYRVLEAPGAAAALAAARERSAPPDLLLTDVILADGNGVAVAREVAARWPGLPIVLISGYAGAHLGAVEALPPHARFLPKPFTPEVLLAEVRAALAGRALATARGASAVA